MLNLLVYMLLGAGCLCLIICTFWVALIVFREMLEAYEDVSMYLDDYREKRKDNDRNN